jgi:hypothetical protein
MTQFPRIHSNGTDGKVLLAEYLEAIDALTVALDAVKSVTVHGRDYYVITPPPMGNDPASVAYGEHRQRVSDLERVKAELTAIAASIHDQLRKA